MTSNEPDAIRHQIERTQHNLAADVDRLTDKVRPDQIVERRVEKTKFAFRGIKEKIMGQAEELTQSVSGTLGNAGAQADSAASSLADSASSAAAAVQGNVQAAPQVARSQTRGNPLAAGLIAFGAGWLLSSLLPASTREQQLAERGTQAAQEHAHMVTGPLSDAANQVKDNLREPAQQAAQSVQATAAEAASTVKDEATSAVADVTSHAQQSGQAVRDTAAG